MTVKGPVRGVGGGWKEGLGALVSGALILAAFWQKYFAFFFHQKRGVDDHFFDPPPPLDALIPQIPFALVLVFGPHVGPTQTVSPRNGLTAEAPTPPWGGGGVLRKGFTQPLPPSWSDSPPALSMSEWR